MKFVSRTTSYTPLHAGARPKITGPVLSSNYSYPSASYDLSKFSDDFTPFFWLWKTITKSLGKN